MTMRSLKYMTISACILALSGLQASAQNSAAVAEKSQMMAEKDPYGLIMTVTAAGVVFIALIILYIVYKYIGKFLSGQLSFKREKKMKNEMTPETALAIAMALDRECSGETQAAIGLALHQYLNDTVHDQESFVLTIKPTFSAWASRYATLRQLPERKR